MVVISHVLLPYHSPRGKPQLDVEVSAFPNLRQNSNFESSVANGDIHLAIKIEKLIKTLDILRVDADKKSAIIS